MYNKLTNNGIVGHLNADEIKRICGQIFTDKEMGQKQAEAAIARSNNINDVTVSKIAM